MVWLNTPLLRAVTGALGLTVFACASAAQVPTSAWRAQNDARDSVGTNHGALVGGTSFRPGKAGLAFSFDGVNDRVDVPSAGLVSASFSFEAWVRFDSLRKPSAPPNTNCSAVGCDMSVLSTLGAGNRQGFHLIKFIDNRFMFCIGGGNGNGCGPGSATTIMGPVVVINRWYHVAAVFDRTAPSIAFYVDGQLAGSKSLAGRSFDVTFTQPLTIGSAEPGPRDPLHGAVDEVRYYASALTAAEVKRAFEGGLDFTSAHYAVGTGPRGIAAADFDGDGDIDLATANDGSSNLTLLANDGAGRFPMAAKAVALGAANQVPRAVAAGRFNNNTKADVVVACPASHSLAIVTDPFDAVPGVQVVTALQPRPVHVAAGDLDSTAIDDIVVAREGSPLHGGGGVSVILNKTARSDLVIPAANARRVVRVAIADLDGDGDRDVAAVARGTPDQILLFTNDSSGTFVFAGALALATTGLAEGMCAGDMDGDGDTDLAVMLPALFPTPSLAIGVFRYTGTGTLDPGDYTAVAAIATDGTLAVAAACGDLDGDLATDLVHVNVGSGDATARFGFGGSSFQRTAVPLFGTAPAAAVLTDLNGDGGADIAIANHGSNSVSVSLSTQVALAVPYGAGCAGSAGIPASTADGVPLLGRSAFRLRVTGARATSPCLSWFAGASVDIDVGYGCRLLVASPLALQLRFTDALGTASVGLGIPNDATLLGFDGFSQWIVFDPNGAFASQLALSNGLRIQIGL